MSVVALMKSDDIDVNTGIDNNQRQQIAEELTHVLADTYVLYLKTQFYHWNVVGMNFKQLHELFEEHYIALAAANDEIAERIRALGFVTPGSLWAFQELSQIEEDKQLPDSAKEMISNLVADHETVIRSLRDKVGTASNANDEVTQGMYAARMEWHEKTAWMLRSFLEN